MRKIVADPLKGKVELYCWELERADRLLAGQRVFRRAPTLSAQSCRSTPPITAP